MNGSVTEHSNWTPNCTILVILRCVILPLSIFIISIFIFFLDSSVCTKIQLSVHWILKKIKKFKHCDFTYCSHSVSSSAFFWTRIERETNTTNREQLQTWRWSIFWRTIDSYRDAGEGFQLSSQFRERERDFRFWDLNLISNNVNLILIYIVSTYDRLKFAENECFNKLTFSE